MLSMSHINNIRDLRKKGSTIKEIAEITHTDPKTVRKYLNQEDFSPQRPVNPERPSILDPFKPIIQKWLDEDKKNWRKQQSSSRLCASTTCFRNRKALRAHIMWSSATSRR